MPMKTILTLLVLLVLSGCGSTASYSVSASSSDDVMSARQAPIMSDNTPIINEQWIKEKELKEKIQQLEKNGKRISFR